MTTRLIRSLCPLALILGCSGQTGDPETAPQSSGSANATGLGQQNAGTGLGSGAGMESNLGFAGSGVGGAAGVGVANGQENGQQISSVGGNSAVQEEADVLGPRTGLAARISKNEYQNSILDVLGITLTEAELDASTGGIPDDAGDGVFKHFADKQTSVEQYAVAYFETAESVSQRADMASLVSSYGGCTETTTECAQPMIASLGRRLFRRSLSQREQDVLLSIFQEAVAEEADFNEAIRWALAAMLQSPQFLFRLEDETSGTPDTVRDVSGPELAARLASFLWVSVPDPTLLDLAESGQLLDEATYQQQVSRMLQDPKAQRFTRLFIEEFSRAELASFEGATDAIRSALSESVVETFQHHFWEAGRSVSELFTTTEFVVNSEVADLLGTTTQGQGLTPLDVSNLPERVGILTHPGSIAGMGDRGTGSFVNRGKYLMERLLCRNPIAVPASLQQELEKFNQDTTGLNEHERVAIRMMRPECWACHTQFEPLAFGFSRFDGSGRYVGETDAQGKPLPLDGWVPIGTEADSPKYANMQEYMQILSTEPEIQTCMTEHFLEFATARSTDAAAKQEAEVISQDYSAAGSTLEAMALAVAKNELLTMIRVLPTGAAQEN